MRLAALVLLAPALALAQTPPKLGYQGRLLKSDGTPEQGTVAVTFTIYDAATAGNSKWSEIQQVALSDGYYAVFLGDVTAFPSGLFSGAELYLEVSLGTEVLSPRQRIDSVAYAMLATDSASLGGKPATAYMQSVSGCTSGQVLNYNGTGWTCGTPAGMTPGAGISVTGSTISLGACPDGQLWKASGGSWVCSPDLNTTYSQGSGIVINANSIAVDPTVVQSRVSGACGAGYYMQQVNANGTVVCAQDQTSTGTVTSVATGAGLTGGPITAAGTVSANIQHDATLTGNGGATPLSVASVPPASGGVPSGAVMFFNLAACPAGWTQASNTWNGRSLVATGTAASVAKTVGTALNDLENRAVGQHNHVATDSGHGHGISDPGHNHAIYSWVTNGATNGSPANSPVTNAWALQTGVQYVNPANEWNVDVGIALPTGTGITVNNGNANVTVNNAGTVAGTNAPYVELLLCQKN